MSDERLVFSTLKSHRGWYFVEYAPPVQGYPFATLSLTILEDSAADRVAGAMERELVTWLRRYPVPIMVSSFTDTGDLLRLSPARECDHLIGWLEARSGAPVLHWKIVPAEQLPALDLSPRVLRHVYSDVPFRTSTELKAGAAKHRRALRVGAALVFVWLVVVPAGLALIEFNAPNWLAWLVLFYSLLRAYVEGLRLWGLWPKTAYEVAAADEERRMRHHHYHCERNPDGFSRLVAENVEREAREDSHREAESLKRQGSETAG